MTARPATRLPWALLALYLVLVSAQLALAWQISRAPEVDVYVPTLVGIPAFIVFVAVGALILTRYPGHRFGWLLCLTGLLWQTFALVDAYTTASYGLHGGRLLGSELALSISNWLFFPGLVLVVAIIPLLFPSGHLPRGRWRVVFWAAVVGMVSTTLGFLLEPIPLEISGLPTERWVDNPYGVEHWGVNLLLLLGLPLNILSGIGAGISIVWRLRHARGIERQQVKWIAYAGALIAAIFAVNTVMFIFELELARVIWLVQVASFAGFPIAAGIAIFQYRLFEIDLLIKRTLLYGVLTAVLGALYLGLVLSAQFLLRTVTPQSDVAIVVSTLTVAALFQPVRRRLQVGFDRRFYRRKYDAEQEIAAFSRLARNEVDLDRLCGALAQVVTETVQPAHISLWLRKG